MSRIRSVVVACLVVLLATTHVVWPTSGEAASGGPKRQCGLSSIVAINGREGSNRIASYTVSATWCLERTRGASTATDQGRNRKNKRRRGGGRGRQRGGPIITCMTDFAMTTTPETVNNGVDFLGATTTPIEGDACAGQAFSIKGTFGEDYIDNVPSFERDVIVEREAGITIENYPLGKVGHFDITVRFSATGSGSCERCETDFVFCDLILTTSISSQGACVRA